MTASGRRSRAGTRAALVAVVLAAAADAAGEGDWHQVDIVVFEYRHPSDEQIVEPAARVHDRRVIALDPEHALAPRTLGQVASGFGVWPSGPRARIVADARLADALEWVEEMHAANDVATPADVLAELAQPLPSPATLPAVASAATPRPATSADAAPRPVVDAAPPAPVPDIDRAFIALPREEQGLADTVSRLTAQGAIRPLLIASWRQPIDPGGFDYPIAIDWPDADDVTEGRLALRARGGVDVDLWLHLPSTADAPPATSRSVTDAPPEANAQATATGARTNAGANGEIATAESDRSTARPSIEVHHRQRIAPGRVYYLDHPWIGCLLRVAPLAPPASTTTAVPSSGR